jgi:Ribbon-helix-helix protein, copG family
MISIRVSQDEYEELERTSREQGANSVSDFVRRVVMNSGALAPWAVPDTWGVVAKITALERRVAWLSRIVKQFDEGVGIQSTGPPLDSGPRLDSAGKSSTGTEKVAREPAEPA